MTDDPNKLVSDQMRKMEIAKAVEELRKQEEEQKRQQMEQDKLMEDKIKKMFEEQMEKLKPTTPVTPEPVKPQNLPKPRNENVNPFETIESKKIITKKTLLNPFENVYTSIDPKSIGNVAFEFDPSFDENKKELFKQQYTKAGQEDKAITIPDGVKAYKIEQKEEIDNEN